MTKATVRTGQCEDTGAGWGQLALIKAIIIVQVELEQIHNRSAHGQDQCGVWHVIGVCPRLGQARSRSWTAQIQTEVGSGPG